MTSKAQEHEVVPPWGSDDAQVAIGRSSLLVRVMYPEEDEDEMVTVRVHTDETAVTGSRVYDGPLSVPSGTLKLGDSSRRDSVDVLVPSRGTHCVIFTDHPKWACDVDVVLSRAVRE